MKCELVGIITGGHAESRREVLVAKFFINATVFGNLTSGIEPTQIEGIPVEGQKMLRYLGTKIKITIETIE